MSTTQTNSVQVVGLAKHPYLYDKQVSADQDDLMGYQVTSVKLILDPVGEDGKPNPKGKAVEFPIWGSPAPKERATYGKTAEGAHYVSPDLNDYIRMCIANWLAGNVVKKGKGYSLSVVLNAKNFTKEIEALKARRARLEVQTAVNKAPVLAATFEQLYSFAVLNAAILQATSTRWPPEEGEQAPTATASTPTAEVAFAL